MKNRKSPGRLPVDVHEALAAIATTGKGRCWYCDTKLPAAEQALDEGWDLQRIDEHPVASIILVCPGCLRQDTALRPDRVPMPGPRLPSNRQRPSESHRGNSRVHPAFSLQPKRA